METRPPEVIERIVRALVPPVSREHVMGDLSERYESPRQYLVDAIRTVPFVIASRIRQTQHPIAVAFIAVFLWFCVFYGNRQAHWLVATIPTAAGILSFVLLGVYRTNSTARPRDVALDIAVYAAFVAVSQGLVAFFAPELLLSKPALVVGFPFSCILLFFLRLQAGSAGQVAPAAARSLSLQDLTNEIRTREALGRRAVRIEIGACVAVMVLFIMMAFTAPDTVTKTGTAIVAAAALFVGAFLISIGRRRGAMPSGLDFVQTKAFYRETLEFSRRLSLTYVWWYVLPLSLGPAVIAIGHALEHAAPMRALGTLAFTLVFGGLLVKLQALGARRAEKRLEQLAVTEEKAS